VQTYSHVRQAESQRSVHRTRHPNDDDGRMASLLFADALDAFGRGNLNRARHHLGDLAALGFWVETLDPGYRLVHCRPATRWRAS
jgi:hypothetical protein